MNQYDISKDNTKKNVSVKGCNDVTPHEQCELGKLFGWLYSTRHSPYYGDRLIGTHDKSKSHKEIVISGHFAEGANEKNVDSLFF